MLLGACAAEPRQFRLHFKLPMNLALRAHSAAAAPNRIIQSGRLQQRILDHAQDAEGLRRRRHRAGRRSCAVTTRRSHADRAGTAGERSRSGDAGSIRLSAGVALRPMGLRLAARMLGRTGPLLWLRVPALLALWLPAVGPALGLPALVISLIAQVATTPVHCAGPASSFSVLFFSLAH